jgi:succinyl-diaminopimelate desuccinylase
MTTPVSATDLAQRLIRCPSVTPAEGGALDLLEAELSALGFACHRLVFTADGTPDVDNLYARWGTGQPNFCFAGHTDVVPVGDADAWTADPFGGEVRDGLLYGRGAVDMKSAIAAFVAAVAAFLEARGPGFDGSISLLITGDEEGPAINGTDKMLDWLVQRGQRIDVCVVGEPTNPGTVGDMIKIGRRGSLNGRLVVHGVQGHTAYPHLADNPLQRLVRMLAPLGDGTLDGGTEHFQPSTLALSTIDTGNPTSNVIPAKAEARFNIRFNDRHSAASLETMLRERFAAETDGDPKRYELEILSASEAFLTEPGALSDAVAGAIEEEVGRRPELSTTGGTSDARFIRRLCPVVEFGLISQTMHKVDEHVPVAEMETLARVYRRMLDLYFARPGG